MNYPKLKCELRFDLDGVFTCRLFDSIEDLMHAADIYGLQSFTICVL